MTPVVSDERELEEKLFCENTNRSKKIPYARQPFMFHLPKRSDSLRRDMRRAKLTAELLMVMSMFHNPLVLSREKSKNYARDEVVGSILTTGALCVLAGGSRCSSLLTWRTPHDVHLHGSCQNLASGEKKIPVKTVALPHRYVDTKGRQRERKRSKGIPEEAIRLLTTI